MCICVYMCVDAPGRRGARTAARGPSTRGRAPPCSNCYYY